MGAIAFRIFRMRVHERLGGDSMPTPYDDLFQADDLMDKFCVAMNHQEYFIDITKQSDDWIKRQAVKADGDLRRAQDCFDPMAPYTRLFLQLLQAAAKERGIEL